MNATRYLALVLLLVAVLAAGCHQHAATGSPDKVYDLKGKVISVKKDQNKIELKHEDIPGLMKAMQMDFGVEDPKLLDGLIPGDQVQGRLKVKEGEYIIMELRKQ